VQPSTDAVAAATPATVVANESPASTPPSVISVPADGGGFAATTAATSTSTTGINVGDSGDIKNNNGASDTRVSMSSWTTAHSQSQSQLSFTNDEELRDSAASVTAGASASGASAAGSNAVAADGNGRSNNTTNANDASSVSAHSVHDSVDGRSTAGNSRVSSSLSTVTLNSVSRQQLRETLDSRGPTILTDPERMFLERLSVEGNDFEVELALEVLQDADLFFDYTTPRHVKEEQEGSSNQQRSFDFFVGGELRQNGTNSNDAEDDATRDAAASTHDSRRTSTNSIQSSWSTLQAPPSTSAEEKDPTEEEEGGAGDGPASAKDVDADSVHQEKLEKPGPVGRVGSEKRRQALEQRRSSGLSNMLWKAHETGLAVTTTASRASLKRRESMDSLSSRMSTGMRLATAATSETIFRTRAASIASSAGSLSSSTSPPKQRASESTTTSTSSISGIAPRRSSLSSSPSKNFNSMPPRPQRPYVRSHSMSGAMHRLGFSLNSSSGNKSLSREGGIPSIPEPGKLNRRASTTSSRKSVTFHGIDEETEVDASIFANTQVSGTIKSVPRRSKVLRRSQSDSIQYESSSNMMTEESFPTKTDEKEEEKKEAPVQSSTLERSDSIPSLCHGHPIRQDSISSIPSLHQGHPIRQDSISSIPSLHHAHPIRQNSLSSIPSLHHGHPIRQDSVSSIPSLHHGHPIRADSIASVPSIHHGHPLMDDSTNSFGSGMIRNSAAPFRPDFRSDASIGSIPSLHHAHPLQNNQYWDEMSEDQRQSVSKEQLMKQYATSDDIASAWLQQASNHREQGRHYVVGAVQDSFGSLPHDVTIPLSDETATTDPISTEDLTNDFGPSTRTKQDPEQLEAPSTPKPVLMRLASRNAYDGEGIEVTELDHAILDEAEEFKNDSTMDTPIRSNSHIYVRDISIYSVDASIRTVNSYDDDVISILSGRRTSHIFRNIRRTLSDESMSNMFVGSSRDLLLKIPTAGASSSDMGGIIGLPPNPVPFNVMGYEDTSMTSGTSWDMNSEMDTSGRFDAWNVIQDDYVNGYGGGGTLGFSILGTCADDESAQPHVLSPPLMESLQAFLPITKSGQNFFLKYSMVRDGASLPTLLKRARGVQYSILAVETIDGEVFGSFTGQAWRKNWNYFGTGESFLWKMRRSRLEKTNGVLDQAAMESEIDVYPYTGVNRFIQLCTHDRIAIGGGIPSNGDAVSAGDGEKKIDEANDYMAASLSSSSMLSTTKDHEWGFGLAIQSDMLQGSSSPCMTFGSPSLSATHPDGSLFEIINVELWTLTPCATVAEAEKLELGKLFLQRDSFPTMHGSMQPY
jgi:TLD